MINRRTLIGASAAAGAIVVGVAAAPPSLAQDRPAPADPSGSTSPSGGGSPTSKPLANLAHLRWLLDDLPLRVTTTHTTWQASSRPVARAPWTYANALPGGGWQRVGGGSQDAGTGHWSQGAFNADDIARAAVVFLRHWVARGDEQSRRDAQETLRALTYLQDADGPNAGQVVLWVQGDGVLNPSALPPESPDPSDSAESYWLARTIWALGEGYAAFTRRSAGADPAFAGFLRERLSLAIGALERGPLARYGRWQIADDVRVPSWLIQQGADASAEACLGLSAYLGSAGSDVRARIALSRLAEGVAAMRSGGTGTWPFGAIIPFTGSQSLWHAWGGEAPAALCRAARLVGGSAVRAAALGDAGSFTPVLLASGGPYNAWSPVAGEAQIAYGAEGRVSGLIAAAELTGSDGFEQLAGLAGGWFFGANPSGRATYDPSTGATFDGVEFDGRINANSGAESTIHGLLAMLALDAHPAAAAVARSITGYTCRGLVVVEAEGGELTAGSTVVRPPSAWTGAANWSGGAYVAVPKGGRVRIEVTGNDGAWVHPIINRRVGSLGRSTYFAVDQRGRRTSLGSLANGGLRSAGVVPADGLLRPFPLDVALPVGTVAVVVESDGDLQLDALMLEPAVLTVRYAVTGGRDAVLYVNGGRRPTRAAALTPASGRSWTSSGEQRGPVRAPTIQLPGGGFAITS